MLYTILAIFTVIVSLYGGYFILIAFFGTFFGKNKQNPKAEPIKRLAALIPCRDEEKVIGQLVDSLMLQRYPSHLYDVYVIINNCTDHSAEIAQRAGAKLIICDELVCSKGEVLRFAFDKLIENDTPKYDGFCIFDADNLVDGGFLQASNDALCNGYHVAQAYRDSKNPGDNWVTSCAAVFFWFMSTLFNASRANLGISASLNGTGILFSQEIIEKLGYVTTSLTEDQEYTAQCVLAGYKIGCMNNAIIYDEQPRYMKDSFTQRRRWGAGSMQCSKKYLIPLLKKAVRERDLDAFDVAMLFLGMYIQVISCMPTLLTMAACVLMIRNDPVGGLHYVFFIAVFGLCMGILSGTAFVLLVGGVEKKLNRLATSTYALMCIYLLTWIPANLACLFTKLPKWTKIDHVADQSIEEAQGIALARSGKQRLHQSKETSA